MIMEESAGKNISRRGFLKTASAIGTALTVAPALGKIRVVDNAVNGTSVGGGKAGVVCRTECWARARQRLKFRLWDSE